MLLDYPSATEHMLSVSPGLSSEWTGTLNWFHSPLYRMF